MYHPALDINTDKQVAHFPSFHPSRLSRRMPARNVLDNSPESYKHESLPHTSFSKMRIATCASLGLTAPKYATSHGIHVYRWLVLKESICSTRICPVARGHTLMSWLRNIVSVFTYLLMDLSVASLPSQSQDLFQMERTQAILQSTLRLRHAIGRHDCLV